MCLCDTGDVIGIVHYRIGDKGIGNEVVWDEDVGEVADPCSANQIT